MDNIEANLPGVLRLVAGEGVVYAPGLRAGCGLSSSFMPAHGHVIHVATRYIAQHTGQLITESFTRVTEHGARYRAS